MMRFFEMFEKIRGLWKRMPFSPGAIGVTTLRVSSLIAAVLEEEAQRLQINVTDRWTMSGYLVEELEEDDFKLLMGPYLVEIKAAYALLNGLNNGLFPAYKDLLACSFCYIIRYIEVHKANAVYAKDALAAVDILIPYARTLENEPLIPPEVRAEIISVEQSKELKERS